MHKLMPAGLALALLVPCGARADTAADVAALRQQMEAMRASYEARLQALEQRVQRAEAAVLTAAPSAPPGAAGGGSRSVSRGGRAQRPQRAWMAAAATLSRAPSASCTTPVTEPPQFPAGMNEKDRVTLPPAPMACVFNAASH